jgi:hypothetical protein
MLMLFGFKNVATDIPNICGQEEKSATLERKLKYTPA